MHLLRQTRVARGQGRRGPPSPGVHTRGRIPRVAAGPLSVLLALAAGACAGEPEAASDDVAAVEDTGEVAERDLIAVPDDTCRPPATSDAGTPADAVASQDAGPGQDAPAVSCTGGACPDDDGDPCTAPVCDPGTGQCVPAPANDGASCETGDTCVIQATCKQGKCAGGKDVCACHVNADCAPLDDADACKGKHYCNKSAWPWACTLNTSTVVICPASQDICTEQSCDPKTAKCVQSPAADGKLCDDGDPCTAGDKCAGGKCTPGTDDKCSCKTSADCAGKDDGDQCNGTLYCDVVGGTCKLNPATVVSCPTVGDTACLKSVCYPKTGLCQATPLEKLGATCEGTGASEVCTWHLKKPGEPALELACDDGDACTEGEVCSGGACKGGVDTCGCKADADCAKLEDGNACNGTLFCNKQSGKCEDNPATVKVCPSVDDTDCSVNACQPKGGGCAKTPIGLAKKVCAADGKGCRWEVKPAAAPETADLPCEDGDPCTKSDVCKQGQCVPGTDTCLCKADLDCKAADDGNLCNGVMYCDQVKKKCALNPASVVVCPTVADTFCKKNLCLPEEGVCKMTPVHTGQLCDDGKDCTVGDLCKGGVCLPGAFTCDCWEDKDCADQEDGNTCNGTLYCDKTGKMPACKVNPATIVVCNKDHGSACLLDTCDPKTGVCKAAPGNEGGACSDGNACTKTDVCKAGSCKGMPLDCDDGSACTNDACLAISGCAYTPAVKCDDGNNCTLDICDAQTGKCKTDAASQNGKACNADDSACTAADACSWGVCKLGPTVACKQPGDPCLQAVCVPVGKQSHQCVTTHKKNGTPCAAGGLCTVGAACQKGKCSGAGYERFFDKQIKGLLGYGQLFGTAAWPDGDLLAVGRTWKTSGGKTSGHAAWIVRANGAGQLKWSRALTGKGAHGEQAAFAAHALKDGGALIAGAISPKSGELDALLARYDESGKLVMQKQYGTAGVAEQARDMLVDASGSPMLAGYATKSGYAGAWATQLAVTGQPVWTIFVPQSKRHNRLFGALRKKDGSLLLFGDHYDPGSKKRYGLVLPVSAGGQAGPVIKHASSSHGLFMDGVLLDDGTAVLGGAGCSSSSPCSWMVGLNADLGVAWQARAYKASHIDGMVRLAKGRLMVAGWQVPLGKPTGLWAWGADRFGNAQWTRYMASGSDSRATAMAPVGKQGVVIAGFSGSSPYRQGRLIRMDPWSHTTCASVGKCLGKPPGGCDDGKICTVDWCHTSKSCQHAVVDKMICDPEDSCSGMSACTKGKCMPTAYGRLWYNNDPYGAASGGQNTFARSATLSDGSHVMVGQTRDGNGQRAGMIRRVSPGGKSLWGRTLVYAKGPWRNHVAGVAPTKEGDMVVLTRTNYKKGNYGARTAWLARYSNAGGVKWWHVWSVWSNHHAYGLISYKDGSFGVIAQKIGWWDANYLAVFRYWPTPKLIWNSHKLVLGGYTKGKPYQVLGSTIDAAEGTTLWGPRGCATKGHETYVVATLVPVNLSSPRRAWLGRLYNNGAKAWTKYLSPYKGNTFATDCDTTSDGGVIVSGMQVAGSNRAWLMRLSTGGGVLWERAYGGPANSAHTVRVLGNGDFYGGGYSTVGGKMVLSLQYYSSSGHRLWNRVYDKVGGFVFDIGLLPGGDLLLGANNGPNWRSLIMRTNPWGDYGCAAAGGCVNKTAAKCNDGKKCTLDWCSYKSGCQHTKIPGC